jgi:DICT domain-containing protein
LQQEYTTSESGIKQLSKKIRDNVYCDVKKRNNVKFSSIADLYAYEDKVLAKKAKNDGVIHIIFRSEIDSIFIAERIDDESVKVYKVSWVHKIE